MKKDYSSSSTKTPSIHQTKTRNKSEPPPQSHLAKERAREEGQMCYAFDWNQENSSTPTQQRVSQTQGGFWSTAGDAASSLIDMVNPVTQAKTVWADANESVRAFRNGEILHGLASTAHTALDVLYFVPVGSVASSGVRLGAKGVSAVGSKLGFFGGKGAAIEKTAQLESLKHPLTGLSPDNVVRLVNELGLETPKDQLILWSGLGRGEAGIKLSQQYAASYGGITLEMTPGGAWLHKMDLFSSNSPFNRQQATEIWGDVSKSLMQQASGQVRSLLGQVRPQSIYQSQEILESQMNRRVLGLDEIYLRPKFETILR